MPETTSPDVTEMSAVHRVFRDAFSSAPGLINGVGEGDAARAGVVGSYYANVLEFLRVHHEGEDALLFPKLVARASDPSLVTRIADQHHGVEGALDAVKSSLAAWTANGSKSGGQQLVAELATLDDLLISHLDEEEAKILPIVAEHITEQEWGELPGHAMGAFGGDNMFLILGLVRDQMSQEQKDRMMEGMPPPAVEAWNAVGINAYHATVAGLAG